MIDEENRAKIRAQGAERMRRKRQRDSDNQLPETRQIDSALVDGLVRLLAYSKVRRPRDILEHPVFGPICHLAIRELARSNVDTHSKETADRFFRRLGLELAGEGSPA